LDKVLSGLNSDCPLEIKTFAPSIKYLDTHDNMNQHTKCTQKEKKNYVLIKRKKLTNLGYHNNALRV